MKSGVDTRDELKAALTAVTAADDAAGMKPHVSEVIGLLQEARPGISVGVAGITVEISTKYSELVDTFQKGLAALDGANAAGAASDLKNLAAQALHQIEQTG